MNPLKFIARLFRKPVYVDRTDDWEAFRGLLKQPMRPLYSKDSLCGLPWKDGRKRRLRHATRIADKS
jgi:hypothetical protein